MNNKLYAITDSQLLPGDQLFTAVAAALKGGCKLVQYRDKTSDKVRRSFEARNLLALCNQYQAQLLINDDVELAKEVGAHGVHLGQGDTNPVAARIILGSRAIIGVTCHDSLTLAQQAIKDSANYIAFGRFFPSSTKPNARPAPISLIGEARQQFSAIPIVVIGGITLENGKQLLDAGADMLAVCHSLFAADDITAQAKKFTELKN
ncbi:thiamine-phosphate pyrophosphorylase [Cellvibrio sp. BR]|jgi:thiamine-phosphate pyrophosphorylase|uniref:thiamine phosphate synthase n=1 Tax=unclassified Cellvibrio TaxID=2624793 RepID=UPI00026015EE|nr:MULTISPECIES: thiamine phosphate synthase [unclassified Cellvibrio]EIK43309.1 thiamine-phosphate pyrophosphorylase [Cellvibrio sp. BR]QEY12102.1 thiamine phosphate synthase [Cellvibrio sp. KY-YJ-3]